MNFKFFEYSHLPDNLQNVSKMIHDLATTMDEELSDSEEKEVGLRFLLMAKDCFVRSKLEQEVN